MSVRVCSSVAFIAAAAVIVACENKSQPVSPSPLGNAPAAVTAAPAQLAAQHQTQNVVTLFDACDPETFNAALGPGACTRSGGVRFDKFLEQLEKHHSVGAWHFAPGHVQMRAGEFLVAINRGGETHTFTEVDEFGGGLVPRLNELTGLTDVAPECAALGATRGRIAPGESSSEKEDEAGVEKYQCCIHPWMRAEVRVTDK